MTGDDKLRQKIANIFDRLFSGIGDSPISEDDAQYEILALIRQDRRELLERLKQGLPEKLDVYSAVSWPDDIGNSSEARVKNDTIETVRTAIDAELQHEAESGEA